MVIFPEEVSYYSATTPIIEKIIQKSIIGSQVVDKYFFITQSFAKIKCRIWRYVGGILGNS